VKQPFVVSLVLDTQSFLKYPIHWAGAKENCCWRKGKGRWKEIEKVQNICVNFHIATSQASGFSAGMTDTVLIATA